MSMTREEAIRTLETGSCYECTWGCESPAKCTCKKCKLIDAVKVAIEALKTDEALKTETKKCPICGSDLYEQCGMCCYEGEEVRKNEG